MQLSNYRVIRVPGNGVVSDDLTTLIGKHFSPIQSGTPSGSIIAYLGKVDITGWVLCDGVSRVNTNSMYDKVVDMGVGKFTTTGFYKPPDLRDKFLAGRLISKTDLDTDLFDGSNTAALEVSNLPSHTHTGTTDSTDTDHIHTTSLRNFNKNINQGDGNGNGLGANRDVPATAVSTSTMKNSLTALDENNNSTHTHSFTTNSEGSDTSFSIVPLHYRVNYLLKL
jgi:microcystin-dependent protein